MQFYTDEAAKERFLALGVEETALKAAKLKEDILTAIEAERADIVALLIKSWIAVRPVAAYPTRRRRAWLPTRSIASQTTV